MPRKVSKIKSFLRSDRKVHTMVLRAMRTREWSNIDLHRALVAVGYHVAEAAISIYLRHGGNHNNSLTDESLLVVLGVLGVKLDLKVSNVGINEVEIKEHFDLYFPLLVFDEFSRPEEHGIAKRITKYYKSKKMI